MNHSDYLLLDRSVEWLNEPADSPSRVHERKNELTRSRSVDELATVDYDMFENRLGSAQAAEIGHDGYTRMQQSSRESVDRTSGGFAAGTVNIGSGATGESDKPQGTEQLCSMEEQELTFIAENEGGDMHILEEWMNAMGGEGGRGQANAQNEPLYSVVGAQIRSENDPIYSTVGSQIMAENDEPIYSQVGSQL